MKQVISIDTSTDCLYVSIRDDKGLFHNHCEINRNHSENLLVVIDDLLNSLSNKSIDELYVSKGPGSFTGLRIGMSCMKGISSALSVPIYTSSTLALYAYCALDYLKENDNITGTTPLFVPIIDAKKGRFYSAGFMQNDLGELVNVIPESDITLSHLIDLIKAKNVKYIVFVLPNGVEIKKEDMPFFSSLKLVKLNDCKNPAQLLIDIAKDELGISGGPSYIRPLDATPYLKEKGSKDYV